MQFVYHLKLKIKYNTTQIYIMLKTACESEVMMVANYETNQ